MLIREQRRIRQLLAALVLSSLITSIPYILNWIPGITWSPPLYDPSVFHNVNHHGYYLVVVGMASLILFLTEKGKSIWLWLWAACYAISVAAMVLNTSLGSWLALIGGYILCAAFVVIRNWKTHHLRLIVAAGLLIVISTMLNLAIGQLAYDLSVLGSDIKKIAEGSSDAGFAGSGRWEMWLNGVRFALMKPWFGHGPENLENLFLAVGIPYDRPHNELIQFAASLGFPAMFFYVAGLAMHLRDFLLQRKKATVLVIGVFALIGAYLISSMVGNSMYYTTPFYMMLLGVSYGMMRETREEKLP